MNNKNSVLKANKYTKFLNKELLELGEIKRHLQGVVDLNLGTIDENVIFKSHINAIAKYEKDMNLVFELMVKYNAKI